MANYQEVSALFRDGMRSVCDTPDAWKSFLETTGKLYKYPFRDQIMIHTQRPDATACASYDTWAKLGCYVKPGSKGIALIDRSGLREKVSYVFDISDIGEKTGKKPTLWKMPEEDGWDTVHEVKVINRLLATYGRPEIEHYSEVYDAVRSLSEKVTAMHYPEIKAQIDVAKSGTRAANFSEKEFEDAFIGTLTDSISYAFFSRIGKDISDYEAEFDFSKVRDFNSVRALSVIGNAVSTISEELLSATAKIVKVYDRERKMQEAEENQKTLDYQNAFDYIALKHESEAANNNENSEGGGIENENGTGLRSEGRDPLSDSGSGEVGAADEVRDDEEEISRRESSVDDGRADLPESFVEALPRDRGTGDDQNGEADLSDDEVGRDHGRPEKTGSDGLGESDELDQKQSRGDDDLGDHRELTPDGTTLSEAESDEKDFADNKNAEPDHRFFVDEKSEENAEAGTINDEEIDIDPGFPETLPLLHIGPEGIPRAEKQVQIGDRFKLNTLGEDGNFGHWQDCVITSIKRETFRSISYGYVPASEYDPSKTSYEDELETERIGSNAFAKLEEDSIHDFMCSSYHLDKYIALTREYGKPEPCMTPDELAYLSMQFEMGKTNAEIEDYIKNTYTDEAFSKRFSSNDFYKLKDFVEAARNVYNSQYNSNLYKGMRPNLAGIKGRPIYKVGDKVSLFLEDRVYTGTIGFISDNEVRLTSALNKSELRSFSRKDFDRYLRRNEENGVYFDDIQSNDKNFIITDDHLGEAGPKAKFRMNIEAIRTLKQIESENREATKDEQETLSKYVGWGGLSDAFDGTKENWKNEFDELKSLLTDKEYAAARASTLDSFYTSPAIIDAMYNAVKSFGFENGSILEPSMGVGNFFGRLPADMKDSKLYGIELDSITGRIAQKLYPGANVQITGFEKTKNKNQFDLAIGNVPFGGIAVFDPDMKETYSIHNYFFIKALEEVRPGGLIAFITSSETMDKNFDQHLDRIAKKAEFVGAIRLPNTAFKSNAGTDVVADIVFLKKRERMLDKSEAEFLGGNKIVGVENNRPLGYNAYFEKHPEMVLGTIRETTGRYGNVLTVDPVEGADLKTQLSEAIKNLHTEYEALEIDSPLSAPEDANSIPADPDVKNYSFTLVNDKIYFRENDIMKPSDLKASDEGRVKGLISIRDCTSKLIRMQLEEYSDDEIKETQAELNDIYDAFAKKFGRINDKNNRKVFETDSSYYLISSLETLDDEGKFLGKAAMFSKRTIQKAQVVTHVSTSMEALTVSLNEKGAVDIPYMSSLTDKTAGEIKKDLRGIIFANPLSGRWETADEYLSGNVREKLSIAKIYAAEDEALSVNVEALERVQPKKLEASDIDVRLGATWITPDYIEKFMKDVLKSPYYPKIEVNFSDVTGAWSITNKNSDYGNVLVSSTYGSEDVNAYKILEDSLNLRDVRVFETVTNPDGSEKRVLNKKATAIAAQKQEALREAFKDWIFKDPDRRKELVEKYNILFNSTRPREYDGSHLTFPGMSPEIELKDYQKNAVAHVLYGDNTLLAHCVGAGKTFEMTAAAMESKRLGICNKSLFVVPNHLTEQWGHDFLKLYPGANILVATKKDFEPANRKRFCSRIATGDYDAVIIGHSQFEKIPLSDERQEQYLQEQVDEIQASIARLQFDKSQKFTVKQMEKTRKSLQAKLNKLNRQDKKDDVITFEELGIDRLFVDEAHNYKNLYLYTKMRNVAGISQTEAQKSSDLQLKCQYLDEITASKGITFATGTPISNSMTELYTNMRYLQANTLKRLNMTQFDAWASSFGETQTAIELAPEGTGYRSKTRFSKFYNLPELISIFKECADIQTPDKLKLPIPEADYENIVLKPSDFQKEMVSALADRAEQVRNSSVDAKKDNMLKITSDGRKLALDQRLMNPLLPDDPNSKTNVCVEKAYDIWKTTEDKKSTQLIFCDLSTPHGDGTYNVYDDIKQKLIDKGVPEKEIAFIHDAATEAKKAELFAKVRSGQVRFLLGSTAKMGAGTNVQDKLIALHHLDVPWRPSDIEQQEGRILRQGNENEKVKIFRYVTEGTFDSYSWQVIENKQKFIGQIMTSKSPVRSCDDVDEAALSYAEVKALATGNPYIKEKMDLDVQVAKLKMLKANHTSEIYKLEDQITREFPRRIAAITEHISGLKDDISLYNESAGSSFSMVIDGQHYTDKKEAGTALINLCGKMTSVNPMEVGSYLGFKLSANYEPLSNAVILHVSGSLDHKIELGSVPLGNIQKIDNRLESLKMSITDEARRLENVKSQFETAKQEVQRPFPKEDEYKEKLARLAELNSKLSIDDKTQDNAYSIDDDSEQQTTTKKKGMSM